MPDHGAAGRIALVADPAARVIVEEWRVQPLPCRLRQGARRGSGLSLEMDRAVASQVTDRHVDPADRGHHRRVVGARRKWVHRRSEPAQPDNVPDRLLIRSTALRRTETGAREHQRSEHQVLQQDFVGFAGNRLGNMPDDGVADVGIREALTA